MVATVALLGGGILAKDRSPAASGKQTPGDPKGAADKHSGQVCTTTHRGSLYHQHIDVTSGGGPGGMAHLIADRSIDFSAQPFKSIVQVEKIDVGRSLVYTYTATIHAHQQGHITITWGPHVQGAKNAVFDYQQHNISGQIDGKAFVPFSLGTDPNSVQFIDGGPSPILKSAPPLRQALERLRRAAILAAANCESPGTSSSSPRAATTDSEPGHFTGTYDSLSCDGCKGAAIGAATVSDVGCCIATLGFGCGVCLVVNTGLMEAGILECESSKACCPVECEPGTGHACCGDGESCLNPATGLCCSAGRKPCVGKECCGSDESCISEGPSKGTCCLDQQVCGQTCCANGTHCVDSGLNGVGKCCPEGSELCPGVAASCYNPSSQTCFPDGSVCDKASTCGSVCCEGLGSKCVTTSSGPTCCFTFVNTACNNQCCPGQNTCINGKCCDVERACGSVCCAAGELCVDKACQADTVQCPAKAPNKCTQLGYMPVCCPYGVECGKGKCCLPGQFRDECGECATESCVH
jgi:hypothetical protein